MANEKEKEKAPTPPTPPAPKYSDDTMVEVVHTDGTVVSCPYSFYKKYYENDGATVRGEYKPPADPRTAELEKLLGIEEGEV